MFRMSQCARTHTLASRLTSARSFGGTLYDSSKDSLSNTSYDMNQIGSGGYCQEKTDTRAANRFVDKTLIATGAAGGFGGTLVRRFASEGGNVALLDLKDTTEMAEELSAKYPKQKFFAETLDLTNEEQVEDAVRRLAEKAGRIDMLFNNAGYQGDFTPAKDYDTDNFRKVMENNVISVFIVMKSVANAMIAQNPQGGSIVNTASMAAHSAPPNMIAYATSKAGVFHMTRTAAKDFAQYNIRVNSISPAFIGPGFMWTRQIELQAAASRAGSQFYDDDPVNVAQQMIGSTPLQRYGSIDEVIGPVTFLLSDDASYLTGVDIQVTGGMN